MPRNQFCKPRQKDKKNHSDEHQDALEPSARGNQVIATVHGKSENYEPSKVE
jgi:hypothetical protein